jgi:hypothetical protein
MRNEEVLSFILQTAVRGTEEPSGSLREVV